MNFFIRLVKLIIGLFLYALGIMVTIRANIGYSPWDVFHVGVSKTTGLSLGTISILVGFIIIIITTILGEKFGLGTVLNMLLIGIFIDFIIKLDFIPMADNFLIGVVMLLLGIVIIAFATYFYISPGFGAGPRDGLMVALSRKSKYSIGICRGIIEFIAAVGGYFLGGMLGLGTLISVVMVGIIIQYTFKIINFDPKAVRHENIKETFENIMRK
ncbi:YczE/YyaS/YitT family protein [Peptostreptococcus canis]|uniref:YitT family protein n=1 Tax=Peptostreptococcus canis TaxID=1159213 RepID=A0ABR6TLF0_9FIRM|nr:hypothetical protein [Peptostreptococcus canis]MBC2576238.1 hypothetical protein [Peptostreptococcus canis]MBP1998227.1 putative membrane protein YczE [Peptostreptococcus canis]